MRFSTIQLLVATLLAGIQFAVYRQVRRQYGSHPRYPQFSPYIKAAFIVFTLPFFVTIVLRMLGQGLPTWFLRDVMYPVYIWHFVSIVLAVLILAGKLLKMPFLSLGWLLGRFARTRPIVEAVTTNRKLNRFNAGRREAVRRSFAIIAGSAAVGATYELYRSSSFEQPVISLQIPNLPESFHGYSIGFISDVHSGIFMSGERMRSYAESVNALGTDIIVVTGDFVNLHLDEVYPLREAFSVLHATDGVYGVLGNHDYYTRRVDEVAAEIEKSGISLLRNRSLELRKRGDSLLLAGVDDTGNAVTAGQAFRKVAAERREGIPSVLLCHRPYFFPDAAATGFDLVLSGHTHGGQVVLGEIGRDILAPARIVSRYVSGLYTEGASQMYINRGLGTVSIPIRFNCPPEITKVVLLRPDAVASQDS